MINIKVFREEDYKVEAMDWGSLTWYVSKEIGGLEDITVGKCVIKPGYSNPMHLHPNCKEILQVQEGTIIHSYEGQEIRMVKGETIIIPASILHNATNIGDDDAQLTIVFTTGERKTIGE